MDKLKDVIKFKNIAKILFWLIFLVFFIYSFQSIMDFEGATNPRHQEGFIRILTALSKPNFVEGETSRQVAEKMWETFQIAFLATVISAILAIPFTYFSARPSSFWGRGFNVLLQPILSIVRSVHPIIAIIPAIIIVGFGSTASVLAITLFSTAILTGSYSEYVQQQTSLTWVVLFNVHFPSLAFKQLPVNILIATVLGFMGGGGIGFLLQQNLNLLNYGDASVAIIACIIVIGSIDLLSRAVWRKTQKNTKSASLD